MTKSVPVLNSTDHRRIWRAGTLTYTFGALVMLSFWLLWGNFT